MASGSDADSPRFDGIIARALCYLCLTAGGLRDKPLAQQAELLEGLGLSRKEAANLLGTTADSITELYRQRRKRRGGNAKKKR